MIQRTKLVAQLLHFGGQLGEITSASRETLRARHASRGVRKRAVLNGDLARTENCRGKTHVASDSNVNRTHEAAALIEKGAFGFEAQRPVAVETCHGDDDDLVLWHSGESGRVDDQQVIDVSSDPIATSSFSSNIQLPVKLVPLSVDTRNLASSSSYHQSASSLFESSTGSLKAGSKLLQKDLRQIAPL